MKNEKWWILCKPSGFKKTLRSCLKSPDIGGDERWTPACAGVTKPLTVIPAQAGIHASATWSHFQNF